jgi:beta-phosphoglucomutase-like phosphatase (HAD superfamily)
MPDSKAVIWDLDGTLVDSEEFHWQSWRDALEPESFSISYHQFLEDLAMNHDPIMRRWLGDGYTHERSVRLAEAKSRLPPLGATHGPRRCRAHASG